MKIFFILSTFLLIISCATPTVVNVIGPNDSALSCEELSSEIAKANKYFNKAQKQKKMSAPHNVGSLLFYLPGVGITMKNVDEASKAAQLRAQHLNKIKEQKKCS